MNTEVVHTLYEYTLCLQKYIYGISKTLFFPFLIYKLNDTYILSVI